MAKYLDSTGLAQVWGAVKKQIADSQTKDNHYTPAAEEYTVLDDGVLATDGKVITGIAKDSKGHVTGVTVKTLSHPSLDEYAKTADVIGKDEIADWAKAATKPSYALSEVDKDGEVAANTAAIATLNGTGEGSVKKVVADKIAEVIDGADDKFDTLREVAEWIAADETRAADLTAKVDANEKAIGTKGSEGVAATGIYKDIADVKTAVDALGSLEDGSIADALAGKADTDKVYSKTAADSTFVKVADKVTKVSELENDAKYVTSAVVDGYATEAWVENKKYLTEHQSLTGYATEAWVEGKKYLTEHQDISGKADKATTLSGYGITDASISVVEGAADKRIVKIGETSINVLVEHQSLDDYAKKTDLDFTKDEALTADEIKSILV